MKFTFMLLTCLLISSCASSDQALEINCMKSSTHNWILTEGEFKCVKATNVCESNFIQESSLEKDCTENSDCEFTPNKCYCRTFEGHQCICAGGPPQKCMLKSQ